MEVGEQGVGSGQKEDEIWLSFIPVLDMRACKQFP